MTPLDNLSSLQHYIPDAALASFAVLIVIVDLFARGRGKVAVGVLSIAALAAAGALTLWMPHTGERLFYGMARQDGLAQMFKLVIVGCAVVTLLVSLRTQEVAERLRGEFFALMLFATYGMFLMVSASNLLIAYLGVELASISSYILAGFLAHQSRSSEAAFKYVIYGSVASGVMLFGVSLLYGMAGTTDIALMGERLASAHPLALAIAVVFLFAGVGYKIASVPFHMWSPDVYEGSPLPVTAFLSVASKAAGFGLTLRIFRDGLGAEALLASVDWPLFLALLSAVTMTVGNLAAMGQKNVKRLLAYSSIAHGGYLLMGIAALGSGDSSAPTAAILFYLAVYLFMNLGAFFVVMHLAEPSRLGSEEMPAYRGLIRRSPALAIVMSVFLFSLIGLPPFAGFWGKLYLFKSVVDASLVEGGVNGHNLVWLVLLAMANSAISLYYYFAVVKAMLLDRGEEETPVKAHPAFAFILLILFLPTLLFGFFTNVDDFRVDEAPPASASVTAEE